MLEVILQCLTWLSRRGTLFAIVTIYFLLSILILQTRRPLGGEI